MPELAEPAVAAEQFDCPTCSVPAGSTCRTRGGKVAPMYHTPRFMLVPQLRAELEVRTPADRGPGRTWEMGPAIDAAAPEAAAKPTRVLPTHVGMVPSPRRRPVQGCSAPRAGRIG
ncbi:zinc finger domain-containing protein [Streptomyces sp. H27-D2]|uniref:zinc finger domain-containing protein n=1 Tax=Streptomyces sp. H27-D2 TaxID=3046304 RepID=UPI003FA7E0FD